jgi:hypothetical protein
MAKKLSQYKDACPKCGYSKIEQMYKAQGQ